MTSVTLFFCLSNQTATTLTSVSRVAQWKRAGPITQRSEDQNLALLEFFFFFFFVFRSFDCFFFFYFFLFSYLFIVSLKLIFFLKSRMTYQKRNLHAWMIFTTSFTWRSILKWVILKDTNHNTRITLPRKRTNMLNCENVQSLAR